MSNDKREAPERIDPLTGFGRPTETTVRSTSLPKADLAQPCASVKDLEWVDEWKNGTRFLADWGTPPICLVTDGTYYWKGGNYPSVEEAKAAASPRERRDD